MPYFTKLFTNNPAPIVPTESEVTMCDNYIPTTFEKPTAMVSPEVLRSMIYRAIAGEKVFETISHDKQKQWEIQVLAHLLPPVWGHPNTRPIPNMSENRAQVCLQCHCSYVSDTFNFYGPARMRCNVCQEVREHCGYLIDVDKLPFVQNLSSWPKKYQTELLIYVRDSTTIPQASIKHAMQIWKYLKGEYTNGSYV